MQQYDDDDDYEVSKYSSNEENGDCSSNRKRKIVESPTDDKLNSQRFINAVRDEECLWKKDHEHYRNHVQRNYAWRKIAAEVNQTVEACKERWEELRHECYTDGDEFANNDSININKFETISKFLEKNLYRPRPPECAEDALEDEFIPRLIRAVRDEESLWKMDHIHYMNKAKRYNAWVNVSKKVNHPAYVCKNRWKTLREQFVRRLHRNKLFSDERFALIADKMMFIKSQIKFRASRCSLPTITIDDTQSSTSNPPTPCMKTGTPQRQPQKPLQSSLSVTLPPECSPAGGFKPVLSVKKIEDPLHFDSPPSMQIKDICSLNENFEDDSHLNEIDNSTKVTDLCKELTNTIKNLQPIVNKIPNNDEEFLRASLILMQDLPAEAKNRIKNCLLEVILNERKNSKK